MSKRLLVVFIIGAFSACLSKAGTNILSTKLEEGETLAQFGLGERPSHPRISGLQVREWATLPANAVPQQFVAHGDYLYLVLSEGQIQQYDLSGSPQSSVFLDVAALRSGFFDFSTGWGPSRGVRGFAFHPDYESNGLVYTMHKELQADTAPDYGFEEYAAEYVLAEWDMGSAVEPSYREVFRVRFRDTVHCGQQIGFNPHAQVGEDDYGLLFCGFGDNGSKGFDGVRVATTRIADASNVAQDFSRIYASVIRVDPLSPGALSDPALLEMNRKRSDNGKFMIPLDNPFVGVDGVREEIYAKGFRNPLSMTFSPSGDPVVGDIGGHNLEEINVVKAGGNYGWPLREGSFIGTHASQDDGSFLWRDESMKRVPMGTDEDPAVSYYVRDEDESNLRTELVAMTGENHDGFSYPVFQYSHEGNHHENTTSAIMGGDYYEGFWAEELRGLYLFGNISTDQLFAASVGGLSGDQPVNMVYQVPIFDALGGETSLSAIVGDARVNMRFGKDSKGNLYLASKTNRKVYRFFGQPDAEVADFQVNHQPDGGAIHQLEFSVVRPPEDFDLEGRIVWAASLDEPFSAIPGDELSLLSSEVLANGLVRNRYHWQSSGSFGETCFVRFELIEE